MNVSSITQLTYWNAKSSLAGLGNLHLLQNLEQLHFNQTQSYSLSNCNFLLFKNLWEIIIQTPNTLSTLQDLGPELLQNKIEQLTIDNTSDHDQDYTAEEISNMKLLASNLGVYQVVLKL